ncbi:MAG: hypothetical protein RLZZ63_127 [Gemmatimonadota bacterium]|jgi:hypothetical protein
MRPSYCSAALVGSAVACFLASAVPAAAQFRRIQVNGYGHQEYAVVDAGERDAYFSIGEHTLFVTGALSERISFLGEYAIRFTGTSSTGYLASIERALVRYSVTGNHAVIAGKVHTPVNYWNDVYHHGRVFFPTIDRPYAFNHFVPLHTLGVQWQGQNLGRSRFGYDLMVGNGVDGTDVKQEGVSPAAMVAVHVKPIEGMRLGVSYYADHLEQNGYGAHSGHTTAPEIPAAERYTGPLDFTLTSLSLAWFGERAEFLHEHTFNNTRTDSLGLAKSHSDFTYLGVRFGSVVPYALNEHLRSADNDLHVYPLAKLRQAVGVRIEATPLVNVKLQLERQRQTHWHDGMAHATRGTAFRMQLAYGF